MTLTDLEYYEAVLADLETKLYNDSDPDYEAISNKIDLVLASAGLYLE